MLSKIYQIFFTLKLWPCYLQVLLYFENNANKEKRSVEFQLFSIKFCHHKGGRIPLTSKVYTLVARYCLDKNYGGWLCVWDRLFGTFQEEKQDEDIVYGLVDQPQFFNVIRHQLFYFPLLANKTSSGVTKTVDHVKKWIYGPGWFPNLNLPR